MEPNLLDPELIADPRGGYARMRDVAPVRLGRMFDGSPAWYVTGAPEVRAVLANPRFVNSVRSLPPSVDRASVPVMPGIEKDVSNPTILDTDGAEHTRLRKLVARAFTARRTAALRPRIAEIANGLLDALDPDAPVDLLAEFAYPLPIAVICELVGVPEDARPDWREWTREMVSGDPQRLAAAAGKMSACVLALAAERRAAPADDLLTVLVQAHDDGDRLTEQELVTMVVALVFAGHETTANLIANSVVALLGQPESIAAVRRDPAARPGLVQELMRLWSPVQLAQVRYATEDLELGGQRIHAGDTLLPVLGAAGSDPREHPDPTRFDSTRSAGNIGFGHGPHHCLGAALAREEVAVALAALFDRFPALTLDGGPEWAPVPGMLRLARLPVLLNG